MKPVLAALALLVPPASDPIVLENEAVRVAVDPRTGAVASMICKTATTFPLIADRGAGVAGTGEFLAIPDLAEVRAERKDVLRLEGKWKGLSVERTFRMEPGESGFRMTDVFVNCGGEAAAVRLAQRSRQKAEPWRLALRSWFGDPERPQLRQLPGNPDAARLEAKGPRLSWRLIGQYGVGFLFASTVPGGPSAATHALGKDGSIEWAWETAELPIPPGGTATVETAVLIDEGGREGVGFGRAGVTVDLRRCGVSGETIPASATLVSVRPGKVRYAVSQHYREGDRVVDRKVLKEGEETLAAGRGRIVPIDVTPDRKGLLYLEVALSDGKGAPLAAGSARSVIDGEGLAGEFGQLWGIFTRTIPNQVYRGTWAEIGAQLAKAGRLKRRAPDARAAERQAFYERKFPYYAELVRGAAAALGAKPEELAHAGPDGPAEACMNVFFNGPDGPINAFSKERSGGGLGGLSYMKVLPDRGYAYHVYECGTWQNGYGVNSEGLSTTGASINCDDGTTAAGRKGLQDWKAAGKLTAPLGSHLLLATCRNVEEALAFIQDPEAPFEFEGNMLLVDRAGNAARLESVGIRRQIFRRDPKNPGNGFFVSGNYPHESAEGLFKIGNDWGWAANTMLRERLIWELAGGKREAGLKDVFRLMESHAAGGMCQHISENPGRLYSSTSYIASCRTGDLWLSHGPPCQIRYAKFSLRE